MTTGESSSDVLCQHFDGGQLQVGVCKSQVGRCCESVLGQTYTQSMPVAGKAVAPDCTVREFGCVGIMVRHWTQTSVHGH